MGLPCGSPGTRRQGTSNRAQFPEGVKVTGAYIDDYYKLALGRQFLAWIKEEIARRAFPVLVKNTIIDFASLGGDAGYIGAAGIARLEYQKLMHQR